jgi:predicted nucleotidyltransferase
MPIALSSLEEYRTRAIDGARRAVARLESLGVDAVITGSLARGTFDAGSDVDFVVLKCPRHLKYAIESIVEDELGGLPFDVLYHEEIPPARLRRFLDGAVRAPDLR